MADLKQSGSCQAQVVIVGAGIAGLSAAEHLLRLGFKNVNVLEATGRIGGRMNTVNFGRKGTDEFVELGANWIHGAAATCSSYMLANQLGVLEGDLIYLDRMEGFCYHSDGKAINQSVSRQMYELFSKWESEILPPAGGKHRVSYASHLRQRLAEEINQFGSEDQEDARCVFNCLMNYLRFHAGGFPEDIPVEDPEGGLMWIEVPGGNIKVPLGMKTIIERLVRAFPPGSVTLNSVVKEINWNADGHRIAVSCLNGRTYDADHVLVTSSLGYLKAHHKTLFRPSLPLQKQMAIDNIKFGKVNKIFLYWDQPFWKRGQGSVKLAWKDEDATLKSQHDWYKKIFAFDEVLNNRNVLVGWISGDEAEYMESLSDEEIANTCSTLIRQFLQNPSIPLPSNITRSKWCSQPYTLGAYSYYSYKTRAEDIVNLSEPLICGKGIARVLFAGDSLTPWACGTMHASRTSALNQAQRIAQSYGVAAKCKL